MAEERPSNFELASMFWSVLIMEESQAQLAFTLEGAQYIFIYEAPNEVLKQSCNCT